MFGRADKLPFTLRWVQGRALVSGGAGRRRRQAPAQLDSDEDGCAMDHLFSALFQPQDGRWRLTVREREAAAPRAVSVAAVTLEVRDHALPLPATDWQFKISGDTAVLGLPTFAFWRGWTTASSTAPAR